MAELKWYVLRVISGQEKKVKSYLETEIERSKLVESIPQVLIPSEKVYEMRNGKKRVRERNFFPGYVLVSADLSNGEAYHTVNNIPGVIGFLGNKHIARKEISFSHSLFAVSHFIHLFRWNKNLRNKLDQFRPLDLSFQVRFYFLFLSADHS